MVDEENPLEVSQKIAELLNNPVLRKRMGEAARSWVIEQHNWDEVADEYIAVVGSGMKDNE